MKKEENNEATKQSKNERIEAFLRERYEFRFNTVKSRTEFRYDKRSRFTSVTKIDLNSIRRELDRVGMNTSTDNIRAILESDFSERVNPVHQYFEQLPRMQGTQAIERLASTVTVQNPTHWVEYLTKWLVGVAANALNDDACQNHVCLVLTGEQGAFKTSWLNRICPKSLKTYLFTGKIDPQNKDVLTLIAECLFINIDDQLKALNKRDENELKNLITTPAVKYRRPYDVYIEDYPHLASFMASVNGNDFLTDPTGSRRFLPFEVVMIDNAASKAINMDEVYSEVMFLLESDFRYWFNDEEIQELHRQSSAFHVQTIEYEMLVQGFEPLTELTSDDCFMTTMQIMSYLKLQTTLTFSEKRMGEALRKAGFVRISKRVTPKSSVYGWLVRKITPNPFNNCN
ncbi:MAG: VapE domain-containing protein [Phocaeicola sp.]